MSRAARIEHSRMHSEANSYTYVDCLVDVVWAEGHESEAAVVVRLVVLGVQLNHLCCNVCMPRVHMREGV